MNVKGGRGWKVERLKGGTQGQLGQMGVTAEALGGKARRTGGLI